MSGVETERRFGLFFARRGKDVFNLSKLLPRAPESSCFTNTDEFFRAVAAHDYPIARVKAEDRAKAACGEVEEREDQSSGVFALQFHDRCLEPGPPMGATLPHDAPSTSVSCRHVIDCCSRRHRAEIGRSLAFRRSREAYGSVDASDLSTGPIAVLGAAFARLHRATGRPRPGGSRRRPMPAGTSLERGASWVKSAASRTNGPVTMRSTCPSASRRGVLPRRHGSPGKEPRR